ncbi:MAG: hypothetical protein IJV64_09950 [Oscillospiraceae bacterium]|nr:hypothetical protein [Oscillospiraceae bacterium]
MIRITNNFGETEFEAEGNGIVLIAEAISTVECLYDGLKETNERLAVKFKERLIPMVEDGDLFCEADEFEQRMKDKAERKHAEMAELARMVEEAMQNMGRGEGHEPDL